MADVVDLVDFSAQREIEKLEVAFNDLADMRAKALIAKQQELVGAQFSNQRQAVGA